MLAPLNTALNDNYINAYIGLHAYYRIYPCFIYHRVNQIVLSNRMGCLFKSQKCLMASLNKCDNGGFGLKADVCSSADMRS